MYQHYDKPVYWDMPNDGADFMCCDCKQRFNHKKVILAQTPNDKRFCICRDCVDPEWLASADYLGLYDK